MKKSVIYKITSPTGRVYIGQSTDIKNRIKKYKAMNCEGQSRLYNSFKKHGYEKHDIVIIEYCDREKLNNRERYWQDFYNVLSKKGLNCILTKTEAKPYVLSKESRKKISNALSGNKHYMYGKKRSEESKKKISDSMKGDKSVHFGKKKKKSSIDKSVETKRLMRENGTYKQKSIKLIHVPTMRVFNSRKEASLFLNISCSYISMIVNGTRSNGFCIFKYKDYIEDKNKCIETIKNFKPKNNKGSMNPNAKKIKDIRSGIVYNSLQECANGIGMSINKLYGLRSNSEMPDYLVEIKNI